MWDPVTGQPIGTLSGYTGGLWAVAWSPDGTRLAAASGDGIRVSHLAPASRSTCLHLDPVTCVDWNSAGIAVGGAWGSGVLDLVVN